MVKVCVVIFVPILIVLYKKLKQSVYDKDEEMMIDAQYCMVSVKLESLVVFAPIQPLIIPIMCMAVQSNRFWYGKMMIGYKWKLQEYNHGSTTVPNWFLIYNVLLEQILMVMFFVFCVDMELHWILIILFIILDIIGIYMVYYRLNNDNNEIQNEYKTKILPSKDQSSVSRICPNFEVL